MTIVAAAIWAGGVIVSRSAPNRHDDLLHGMHCLGLVPSSDWLEGFLTDEGKFLGRREALMHARECGQRLKVRSPAREWNLELATIDLW